MVQDSIERGFSDIGTFPFIYDLQNFSYDKVIYLD